MEKRTRTIASLFSVAMAAMLIGAVVTQVQHPTARAGTPEVSQSSTPSSAMDVQGPGTPITLTTFRDIARRVGPGVVNITSSKEVKVGGGRSHDLREFFGDDMLDRFFGGRPQSPQKQVERDLGSGFIIDKAGYILTNRHVIDDADKVRVTLANGGVNPKQYDAKIIGKDARTDVALLKIEPKEPLTVLDLGDSSQEEVGEFVMAIGNPFGLSGTVTVGVVSFKGRPTPLTQGTSVDMIQTDAAINPGNSGGPLLNTRGQVIGINTLIITQGAMQSAGVGFAVPINVAKEILPQLRDKGKVIRGWLGVSIRPVSDDLAKTLKLSESRGAYVEDVTQGSPAEKAGVKPEDVILSADSIQIGESAELTRYIAGKAPGTTVKLDLRRNGAPVSVSVTLGTFPDEGQQASNGDEGAGREKLGMTLRDLTPDLADRLEMPRGVRGVVVMEVEPGSNAEESGLQRGDVVVSVDGRAVESVDGLETELAKAKAVGVARLRVRRAGGQFFSAVLKLQ
jgi:serine protease Do